MTEPEYKVLQERLTLKIHSPYCPVAGSKAREGYREGLRVAKSLLHAFYLEFGEDTKEVER